MTKRSCPSYIKLGSRGLTLHYLIWSMYDQNWTKFTRHRFKIIT